MEAKFSQKPDAKKQHSPTPEPLAEAQFSSETEQGATAGVPLFLQQSPLLGEQPSQVQPKLTVSQPSDPDELEAEAIADQILQMPMATASGHTDRSGQETTSSTGIFPTTRFSPLQLQRSTTASHPTAASASTNLPAGAGQPLDAQTRNYFEPRFNRDLSAVRVHTGTDAITSARNLQARAYTVGQNIVFGDSEYAPTTATGRHLLAHELAHTLQQQTSPHRIRRNGMDSVIVTIRSTPGLSYHELRRSILPDQWTQLDNAAQARALRQQERQGLDIDTAERDRLSRAGAPEIEVPLQSLLRPQDGGVSNYPNGLFQAMVSNPTNTLTHAAIVRGEMARRWTAQNTGLVEQNVRIGLIDPTGQLDDPAALTFQVEGHPIPTQDGGLYIFALDRATSANGTLESIQAQMTTELQEMQNAANLGVLSQRLIQQGRSMIQQGHRAFSADDVSAWSTVLNDGKQRISSFRAAHASLSSLLEQSETDLNTFIQEDATPFATAQTTFLAENAPPESYGEASERQVRSCMDDVRSLQEEGGFWNYLFAGQVAQSCNAQAGGYAVSNIVTFNYVETSRQFHEAFRGGHISLEAFESGMSSAATRSLIVGGITGVLTIATLGLAGPVLGTGASLGSQIFYWGGTAAMTTMASMTAESLYTSSVSLGNPYAQQIWNQGLHTPGDILLGGAMSFGIAGAITAAGPLLNWLSRGTNTQMVRALAVASAEGRALTPIAGVEVRQVSAGVVEVSLPGQQGMIRVTPEGFQVMTAAGRGQMPIAEFPWQTTSESPLVSALREHPAMTGLQDVAAVSTLGGPTVGVGVTPEGWVVLAPRTSTPITTGLWGDLAAGGMASARGVSPLAGEMSLLAGRMPPLLTSGSTAPVLPAGGMSPLLPGAAGSGVSLLPPGPTGPLLVDVQAGTPFFLNAMVAANPGSRGVAIEAGDWMIGYQGANPMFQRDLAMSRLIVQNMPRWPSYSPDTFSGSLDDLLRLQPQNLPPETLDPAQYLFPRSGPVTSYLGPDGLPQPFFPSIGQNGRLIPLHQTDVTGLLPTTHPGLHGQVNQLYWRRPFALQRADAATQQAMGTEINQMLRRDGFAEFRILAAGNRRVVDVIKKQIPGAEVVEVNQGMIRRFLENGTVPNDTREAEILRAAERDMRKEFNPLGEGTFNRIIRVYKRGQ